MVTSLPSDHDETLPDTFKLEVLSYQYHLLNYPIPTQKLSCRHSLVRLDFDPQSGNVSFIYGSVSRQNIYRTHLNLKC